jgi:hypothetical protein
MNELQLCKNFLGVPGHVLNFRAEVLGSDTIRISWEEPRMVGDESKTSRSSMHYLLFFMKANSSQEYDNEEFQQNATHISVSLFEKVFIYGVF